MLNFTEEDKLRLSELDPAIELGETLKRLYANEDFKKLVELYTVQTPLSLYTSLGGIEKNQTHADNVLRQLEAIALFKTFLDTAVSEADIAESEKQQLIEGKDG